MIFSSGSNVRQTKSRSNVRVMELVVRVIVRVQFNTEGVNNILISIIERKAKVYFKCMIWVNIPEITEMGFK